jgi:glucose-6-phosphate 1-dehydrogenase
MTYQQLLEVLDPNSQKVFYLALQPQHYPLTIKGLVANNLISPDSEIIVEKPLALSALEAEKFLHLVRECGVENQTQLVEHFNQKEALANTIYFRENTPFETSLNRKNVLEIRIYALEKITVPSERVQFMDSVRSQLRDMITHLLSAMLYPLLIELPENLDVSHLRKEKEKIALNMRVVDAEKAIWGQYEGYPTPTTSLPALP